MKEKTFTERVYETVSTIPRGKVATYAQVARLSGNAQASRAVGRAMHTNTDTKRVPCHRVVASNGALTGYAFGEGIATKRALLKNEGVLFDAERVNLRVSGWKK